MQRPAEQIDPRTDGPRWYLIWVLGAIALAGLGVAEFLATKRPSSFKGDSARVQAYTTSHGAPMNILLLCSALLVFLYAGLSLHVSMTRRRLRNSSQVTEADLQKAIRAHGNASEYILIFVALFVFLSAGPPTFFMTAIAVLATISRISHAVGMLRAATVGTRHPLKFGGALGTYICLFLSAAILLSHAVGGIAHA